MVNPLRSLRLQNFGPHRDLHVDFADGLNLIRARNRSGKSWVLRALSLLLYNYCPATYNKDDALCEVRYRDPNDSAARRARFFSVTAEFADGSQVTRYRDADRNEYRLQRPGEEPVIYEAVGSGFFEPVGQVTGIYPLCLDGKNDYRLSLKLNTDPKFFVLGESGQKQDDILTRLLGMNVISSAETLTEKDIRERTSELGAAHREEAQLSETLRRLSGAPEAKDQAEQLAGLTQQIDALDARARRARELLQSVAAMQGQKRVYEARIALLSRAVTELGDLNRKAREAAVQAQSGRSVLNKVIQARQSREQATKQSQYLGVVIPHLAGRWEQARERAQVARSARETLAMRDRLIGEKAAQAGREEATRGSLCAAETEYQRTLQEAGVCPICGQTTRKQPGKELVA